jgi:ubiquinone/menaquinone biosynthesis C-methylase UbiE
MADSVRSGGLSEELRKILEVFDEKGVLLPEERGEGGSEGIDQPRADKNKSAGQNKDDFRGLYNAISRQLNLTQFGTYAFFLNYGYVPDENRQYSTVELPPKYINKNSAKLVLEVIGDCDLKDRNILDVGCGRGGTIHVMHEFFQAKSITGIDLSPVAIEFCRRAHRYPGVHFQEGDAENLPFPDSSFDVVTNVESSHSYPDLAKFYTEVARVLVPGGYFLYTDVLQCERFARCVSVLRSLGFEVETDRDISSNVLRSSDQIAFNNSRAYGSGKDARLLDLFLAAPGSSIYEGIKSGALVYRILKLRKRG